jgi:hypothetical protein
MIINTLQNLLQENASNRPTASAALRHDAFQECRTQKRFAQNLYQLQIPRPPKLELSDYVAKEEAKSNDAETALKTTVANT